MRYVYKYIYCIYTLINSTCKSPFLSIIFFLVFSFLNLNLNPNGGGKNEHIKNNSNKKLDDDFDADEVEVEVELEAIFDDDSIVENF